jgi:hypothetical protein
MERHNLWFLDKMIPELCRKLVYFLAGPKANPFTRAHVFNSVESEHAAKLFSILLEVDLSSQVENDGFTHGYVGNCVPLDLTQSLFRIGAICPRRNTHFKSGQKAVNLHLF